MKASKKNIVKMKWEKILEIEEENALVKAQWGIKVLEVMDEKITIKNRGREAKRVYKNILRNASVRSGW